MKRKLISRFFCVALGAQVNSPEAWVKYADKEMRGDQSETQMSMTITTPDWSRTLDISSSVKKRTMALSTIHSPAKEKGIKTLRLNNQMWNYFPKLKRKVAVSSSMLLASWMGSDFTNDDVLKSSTLSEDYSHRFLQDQDALKIIEHKIKDGSKAMWPKIVGHFSSKDCLPRRYDYFDKEGTLKRSLMLDDIKTFDGHKTPTKLVMKPNSDEKKETTLIYHKIKFNVDLPDEYFSEKELTK